MILGSKPAVAIPKIRAFGVKPWCLMPSRDANNKAQEPSLIPDALPAVTLPPSRNGVANLLRVSKLLSRRCSSCAKTISSFFR